MDSSAEEFNFNFPPFSLQVCLPQAFDNFVFPGGGVGVNLILGSLSNNDSNKNVT